MLPKRLVDIREENLAPDEAEKVRRGEEEIKAGAIAGLANGKK